MSLLDAGHIGSRQPPQQGMHFVHAQRFLSIEIQALKAVFSSRPLLSIHEQAMPAVGRTSILPPLTDGFQSKSCDWSVVKIDGTLEGKGGKSRGLAKEDFWQ